MEISIGIDLGTTNTVVSIGRRGIHGDIEVQTEKITQVGEDRITPISDELLPSVLYIEDGIPYVGQVAKAMKSQNRKRVITNSKNYIGTPDYKWEIDNKEYTPEVVASHYLKAIRTFLKNKFYNDEILKSAVITVPASFDIDQKRATKTAARLAGFDESQIMLISEPTAAMLDFINEQRKFTDESKNIDFRNGKKVLVFDLGGGTCDVAIINIKIVENTVQVEEVSVSPHTLIGGALFDSYAVLGIINEYNKINNIKLEETVDEETFKELKNKLSILCEKAKLFFSGRYDIYNNLPKEDRERAIKNLNFPVSIPNILNGKPFMYELTMDKYNDFIMPLLENSETNSENVIQPIEKTLMDAKISVEDIDHVFCVGGMTMYPLVVDALTKYFKKEPLFVLNRMHSVSRGAAVFHHYNVSTRESKDEINIVPKMPQSVFLNVGDNFPITLIEAKTEAGTPVINKEKIKVNSEVGVELELYTGRSFFDPELKRLKNVKLNFPHGVKRGSLITLKLEYTLQGILNFEAWLSENEDIRLEVRLDDMFMTEKDIKQARENYDIGNTRGII